MSLSFKLEKSFYNFNIDVSLDLGKEMTVLFGPSGAGKSTILNMLAGIVKPDSGFVKINGKDIYNSEKNINVSMRKRRVGYVFQDLALFPHMSVFQNIAYGLDGMDSGKVEEKVKEILVLMRLVGLEERYPAEISGGQKQRVALARTLVTEPRLLLLDEPFTALDYPVREKLRTDLVRIHKRYPITTVVVTHDQEEAYILSEKIAVLNDGMVEQFGTKGDIFYSPGTRKVAKLLGIMNIFDGVVHGFEGEDVLIRHVKLGIIKARKSAGAGLKEGKHVTFGIRPEEVMVLREDRNQRNIENAVDGALIDVVDRGTQNTLYLKMRDGNLIIKVDIPNFAYRKMGLRKSKEVMVSLKKECIWVID